jgi:hypothetical protein
MEKFINRTVGILMATVGLLGVAFIPTLFIYLIKILLT